MKKKTQEPKSFVESIFVDYTPNIAKAITIGKKKSYYKFSSNEKSVMTYCQLSRQVLDFLKDSGIKIDILKRNSVAPVRKIRNIPVEIMSTAWKKGKPTEVLIRISADDEDTLYERKKVVMNYLQKIGSTPKRTCHWICTTKYAMKTVSQK